MPFSRSSTNNSNSKKSKKMARSKNKQAQVVSPKPTTRRDMRDENDGNGLNQSNIEEIALDVSQVSLKK